MPGNQDQAEYWSSNPGLKWIRFEEELDVIFENVNTELIRRVGHVRVFAALGSSISAVLILFPVLTDPIAWSILRVCIGF